MWALTMSMGEWPRKELFALVVRYEVPTTERAKVNIVGSDGASNRVWSIEANE